MNRCFKHLRGHLDSLGSQLRAAGLKVTYTVFSEATRCGKTLKEASDGFCMANTNICNGLRASEKYFGSKTRFLVVSDGQDTSKKGRSADIAEELQAFPPLEHETELVVLGVGSNAPWRVLYRAIKERYGSNTPESQKVGTFVEWENTNDYVERLEAAKNSVGGAVDFPSEHEFVPIEPVMAALYELLVKGDELGRDEEVVDLPSLSRALARLNVQVRQLFAKASCERDYVVAREAVSTGKKGLVHLEGIFGQLARDGDTSAYENRPPRLVYGRSNPDAVSLREEIASMRAAFRGFEEQASSDRLGRDLSDAGLGSIITGKGPSSAATKALTTYAKAGPVDEKNRDFKKYCSMGGAKSLVGFVTAHPLDTFAEATIVRSADAVLAPFTTVLTRMGPRLQKAAYTSFFVEATGNAIVPLEPHPFYGSKWMGEVFAFIVTGAESQCALAGHALLAARLVYEASQGRVPGNILHVHKTLTHTAKWKEYLDLFSKSAQRTVDTHSCSAMPQFILGLCVRRGDLTVACSKELEESAVMELFRRWHTDKSRPLLVSCPTQEEVLQAVDASVFTQSWTEQEALHKFTAALQSVNPSFSMVLGDISGVNNFGVTVTVIRTMFETLQAPNYMELYGWSFPDLRREAIGRVVKSLAPEAIRAYVRDNYRRQFARAHAVVLGGGPGPLNEYGMSTVACGGVGCCFRGRAVGTPKELWGKAVMSPELSQHIAGDDFIPGFHSTVLTHRHEPVHKIVELIESGHVLHRDGRVDHKHAQALALHGDLASDVAALLRALDGQDGARADHGA